MPPEQVDQSVPSRARHEDAGKHREVTQMKNGNDGQEEKSTFKLWPAWVEDRRDYLLSTAPTKRLRADIRCTRERLDSYKTSNGHIGQARGFLDLAEHEAIPAGDVNGGWKCLNEALREEIYLVDDTVLSLRIIALEKEADAKLKSWRKVSVREALRRARRKLKKPKDKDATDEARQLLVEATALRDAHFDNLYYKKDLTRSRMAFLAAVLTIIVIVFLLKFGNGSAMFPDVDTASTLSDADLLLGGSLLGAMGASLSALMSFASQETIPDQFQSIWVTIARPAVGAASGLGAVFVGQTDFFTISGGPAGIWFLALGFGFSERLVMGAMGKLGQMK